MSMDGRNEAPTAAHQQYPFSVSDLITGLPLLASGFAFMYVIGYFLAYDLAWFAFFSLSEHIVFALRALPFAIATLAGIRLAINDTRRLKRLMRWWPWIVVAAGMALVLSGHPGFGIGFLVIAVAAFGIPIASLDPVTESSAILYLVPQLMVMSLMAGWLSGFFWKIDAYFWTPDGWRFRLAEHPMHIHLKLGTTGNVTCTGHVIFVGNADVLFYEYSVGKANLVKWSAIDHIHEFENDDPQSAAEPAPPAAKKSCLADGTVSTRGSGG
jgi:hypothetical protein